MQYFYASPSSIEVPLQSTWGRFRLDHLAEYLKIGGFPGIVGVRFEKGKLIAMRDSAIAVASLSAGLPQIMCVLVSADSELAFNKLENGDSIRVLALEELMQVLGQRSNLNLLYFEHILTDHEGTMLHESYLRLCDNLFEIGANRFDPFMKVLETKQALVFRLNFPLEGDLRFARIWEDFLNSLGPSITSEATLNGVRIKGY